MKNIWEMFFLVGLTVIVSIQPACCQEATATTCPAGQGGWGTRGACDNHCTIECDKIIGPSGNDWFCCAGTVLECGDPGFGCEDGDPCTTNDKCNDNDICVGGPQKNCADSNVCTDDYCESGVGCKHVANTAPCDDGNKCTTGDQCKGKTCQPGTATNCEDGLACTDLTCDPASGCLYKPLVCIPPNRCYTSACVEPTGCVYTPLPNIPTRTLCGEKCTNLNTDPENCGACSHSCPSGYICTKSVTCGGKACCIPKP